MSNFFFILTVLAAFAVLASLVLGLFVMAKGGETAKKHSNRLMRARVWLQGLALVLLALAILSGGKG